VLVEILRALRSIDARLASLSNSVSSVEVKTSQRGHDITVKAYDQSPVRAAGDMAIDEYVRVRAEIEQRLIDGWTKTTSQQGART
jgi:hypothetical protein